MRVGIRDAQFTTPHKLALALALSASAHALALAHLVFVPLYGPQRGTSSSEVLNVRLEALPVPIASARVHSPAPQSVSEAKPSPAREARASSSPGLPTAEIFYRASELDERAVPLNEAPLEYPEPALQARLGGSVTLRLFIGQDGALRKVELLDSQPPGVFDQAALKAVSALRFRPATRNQLAVASVKTIEVPFHPDCTATGSCIGPQASQGTP
jgi:TonB family protein